MPAPLAIWALTPNAADLACRLVRKMAPADGFTSARLAQDRPGLLGFESFKKAVAKNFWQYEGHLFIMAAGIVVRTIAPHLVHKTQDPAVAVMDEAGRFAVSLVSGHLGGANQLAANAARASGGRAVITTATDVNGVTAIDLIAKAKGLKIENPESIKRVNMALLTGEPVTLYDPFQQIGDTRWPAPPNLLAPGASQASIRKELGRAPAGILIDDRKWSGLDASVLVLRPRTLSVGMGCNRNTSMDEMLELLENVFEKFDLAINAVAILASVDLKADEPGLLALARRLDLDLTCFTRPQLRQVPEIPNPSPVVSKHLGVESVCEAAAILGACRGRLIVPKQKSANVTLAVARKDFTS